MRLNLCATVLLLLPLAATFGQVNRYDKIGEYKCNRAIVKLNTKYSFIDRYGKEIVPFEWDWMDDFKGGAATFGIINPEYTNYKNNSYQYYNGLDTMPCYMFYGLVDTAGKICIPAAYGSIEDPQKGYRVILSKSACVDLGPMTDLFQKKYGLIDSVGHWIVPILYDELKTPYDGSPVFLVNIGKKEDHSTGELIETGKWGAYNSSGKMFIPLEFESLSVTDNVMIFVKNGKYGLLNIDGSEIIQPKYDLINGWYSKYVPQLFTNNGIFLTNNGCSKCDIWETKGGLYGLIDRSGNELISTSFRNIQFLGYDLISLNLDGKMCLMECMKGGKSEFGFDSVAVTPFHTWNRNGINPAVIYVKDDLMALRPIHGNTALEFKYKNIHDLYFYQSTTEGDQYYSINCLIASNIENKKGLITYEGNKICDFQYDEIKQLVSQPPFCHLLVTTANNKQGLIDTTGKLILKSEFESIEFPYPYDRPYPCLAIRKNGKQGLADFNGNILVNCEYDNISNSGGGYKTEINRKYGIISPDFKVLVAPTYDDVTYTREMIIYKKDNLYGILDANGKQITGPVYSKIERFDPFDYDDNGKYWFPDSSFKGDIFTYKKDGRFGFLSTRGVEISQPIYLQIGHHVEGYISVKTDKGWGCIDYSGRTTIPCQYRNIHHGTEGIIAVQGDKGVGFIDVKGKIIAPLVYKSVHYFEDGKAKLIDHSGKVFLVDKSGKITEQK